LRELTNVVVALVDVKTKENQAAVEELARRGVRVDRHLQGTSTASAKSLPVQTYFVPLPEISLFGQVLYQVME
jgi:hypothetical protein